MKRAFSAASASLGVLVLFGLGQARAQQQYLRPPTSPYARPTISPYLNLTRGGNQALNYYNLVVPTFQFNNDVSRLQQQVNSNRQQIAGVEDFNAALFTGHIVRFQSGYQQYFNNLSAVAPASYYAGLGGGFGSAGRSGAGAYGQGFGATGGARSPFGGGGLGTGLGSGSGGGRPPTRPTRGR